MEIIEQIGAYAGLASIIGLAVLSALYFSQARDVKRLREWAGRAPERAAEQAAAPQRVVAQPQRAPTAPPVPGRATPAPGSALAAAAGAKPAAATAAAQSKQAPAPVPAGAPAEAGTP